MPVNQFNICPSCVHRKTCVLTAQKDKVWSCSEYDEDGLEPHCMLPNSVVKNKDNEAIMTLT